MDFICNYSVFIITTKWIIDRWIRWSCNWNICNYYTTMALFAYVSGNIIAADYLNIMYIPNISELVIICLHLLVQRRFYVV